VGLLARERARAHVADYLALPKQPEQTRRTLHRLIERGRRESAQGRVFRAFLESAPGPAFARIRRERVAYAETEEGFAAIAGAVFQGQEIVATLAIVGTRVSVLRARAEITAALKNAAGELSAQLGYVDPQPMEAA
jgi:hypothetical protein